MCMCVCVVSGEEVDGGPSLESSFKASLGSSSESSLR